MNQIPSDLSTNTMNACIIFLVLITTIANALEQEFVDEFMDKVQEYGEICAQETHATADDIAELVSHQIPPSTHEAKCMIFCIQKKFKTMKEDGGVDRPGAMMALKPLQKADAQLYQKVLKIFITCASGFFHSENVSVKPLADPCDTASALAECGKNEAEAIGLDESILM